MPSQLKRLLNPKLNQPNLGNEASICFKCGRRTLLPRQAGNLCSPCFKEVEEKKKIDHQTRQFLKKLPPRLR